MLIQPKIKVSFPQWGNYSYAFKYFFEKGFNVEYITPPAITKNTLEIGSKNSPDFVCSPFKYCLGSYIEALEQGANFLLMISVCCRLDYYGELHEQILRDLGYEFKFLTFYNTNFKTPKKMYQTLKYINPEAKLINVIKAIPTSLKIIKILDKIEDYIRKNVGFEINDGDFDKVHNEFLKRLDKINSGKELTRIYKDAMKKFKEIPIKKPKHLLKIAVVGEYYTIMEPFSNHNIEKTLAKMGMVVQRNMNLTNSTIHNTFEKCKKNIKSYSKFNTGATAPYTIDEVFECAKEGFDGVIHIKSFGCMPEVDAMPILQSISSDYKIPILFFSFDSQTSETGIRTRLEAFYDMVVARKKKQKEGK